MHAGAKDEDREKDGPPGFEGFSGHGKVLPTSPALLAGHPKGAVTSLCVIAKGPNPKAKAKGKWTPGRS